jgi:hypothetical protein
MRVWLGRLLFVGLVLASASRVSAQAADARPSTARVTLHHSPFLREPSPDRPAVHFVIGERSDRSDLTLYLQREVNPVFGPGGSAETGAYEPLCQLPCDLTLRSGSYMFALAGGHGSTHKLAEALALRGGEHVQVEYDRRIAMRVSGWALIVAGVVAGGILLGHGQSSDRPVESVVGGVLGGLCIVGGLWLANMPDRAHGQLLP